MATQTSKQLKYRRRNFSQSSIGFEPLEDRRLLAVLQPGDANQDLRFDESDFIMAHKAGKFENGEAASWSEGDWNGAPGGEVGAPPVGDGAFNSSDYVVAFTAGKFMQGPYDPMAGPAVHERTSLLTFGGDGVIVTYDSVSGQVRVVSDRALSTFHLYSNRGLMQGNRPAELNGLFDVYNANSMFKLNPGGFANESPLTLGAVMPPRLTTGELLEDLETDGSFLEGGGIGNVEIRCLNCFDGTPAEVTGQVYDDANDNGQRDPGELGLDNQSIRIRSIAGEFAADGATRTTSIDLNQDGTIDPVTETGIYRFVELPPGSYSVTHTPDFFSRPVQPADSMLALEITEGQRMTGANFGVDRVTPSTIRGQVFDDANENGVRDPGEVGLNGVEIDIIGVDFEYRVSPTTSDIDLDGNGTIDESEQGVYQSGDLPAQNYIIRASFPLGTTANVPASGQYEIDLDTGDNRIDVDFAAIHRPLLQPGDTNQDLRFDESDFVLAHKGGKYETELPATWSEGDWSGAPGGAVGDPPVGDGVFNSRDYVAAFVTYNYLAGPYNPTAGPAVHDRAPFVHSGTTDVVIDYNAATGELSLSAQSSLSTLHIVSESGWFSGTKPAQIIGVFDVFTPTTLFILDPTGNDLNTTSFGPAMERGLTIEQLLADLRVDGSLVAGGGLGEVGLVCSSCFDGEPATITGQLYDDANRNGQQDAGELGLNGWTVDVQLRGEFNVAVSATTGDVDLNADGTIDPATESGVYVLDALPPGTATVSVRIPELSIATTDSSATIELQLGGTATIDSFGVAQLAPGRIGVEVFEDENSNGVFDPGEMAIRNATVRLVIPDSPVPISRVTVPNDLNEDGTTDANEIGVVFGGLVPGEYQVYSVLVGDGWSYTNSDSGQFTIVIGEGDSVLIRFGQAPPVPGDVNSDGVADHADIQEMCRSVNGLIGGSRFDRNEDRRINLNDLVYLIETEMETSVGDADLNGVFDSGDLVAIFQAGVYEDQLRGNATWATGDWNCDGDFDAFDIVFAFQRGGFVQAAVANGLDANDEFGTAEIAAAIANQPQQLRHAQLHAFNAFEFDLQDKQPRRKWLESSKPLEVAEFLVRSPAREGNSTVPRKASSPEDDWADEVDTIFI